jgi:RHS repeat-associated protein
VRRVFTKGASPSFDYDPYGVAAAQNGAPTTNFTYAGMFYEPQSGLYLTTNRPYSSATGRFLSRDPAGENADPEGNLYPYAANDPVNANDPLGLCPKVTNGGEPPESEVPTNETANPEIEQETEKLTAREQLAVNRASGTSFEQVVGENLEQSGLDVGKQITIETRSGVQTRLDFLTKDPKTGEIGCIECKTSATAPLTPKQTLTIPEIGRTGGMIVGAGKPGFPGGTQLPPTVVQIIRGP